MKKAANGSSRVQASGTGILFEMQSLLQYYRAELVKQSRAL